MTALGIDPASLTYDDAWIYAREDGYSTVRDGDGTWVAFTTDTVVIGDSYPDQDSARYASVDHWREQQPEWCPRCGDQGVCPECVGA